MSNTIEILRWTVYRYTLVATTVGPNCDVEVRASNAIGQWLVLTVTGAHTVGPKCRWGTDWWPGKPGEELRRSIERKVITATRAHWAKECQG